MRHLTALLGLVCACATTAPEPDPIDPEPVGPNTGCDAADLVIPICGPLLSTSFLALASPAGIDFNQVVVVDSATGSTCPIIQFPKAIPVEGVSSLASMGTDVFFCAADPGARGYLTHVSLIDGSYETATTECIATTAYGGKLVVLREPGSTIDLIDSIGMWMTPQTISVPHIAARLGFGDDKLYSTEPQPESVLIYEPSTRITTTFDMAPNNIRAIGVMGLAAHGGALTLLDGLPDQQSLISVDAVTGAEIERIPVGPQITRLHGLSNTCSGNASFL